jgi:nitrogen fixation NifU-like protein
MSDTEQLYQSLIMDRARAPRHAGKPAAFDAHAHGDNPMCGDQIELYLTTDGPEAAHVSRGCAIMVASADLMADAIAGKSPAEINELAKAFETVVTTGQPNPALGDLNALAGVSEYRSRIRCATLPWSALADALHSATESHAHE